MTKSRLSFVVSAIVVTLVSQGCDPANTDVYLTNNTPRDIYASFALDATGSRILVPANTRVLVLKDSFQGAHEAIIEDVETHKTIAKMDCRNSIWKGNSAYLTYPP